MNKFVITIEKNKTSDAFLNFIRSLNFVLQVETIAETKNITTQISLIPKPQKKGDFSELFGIWQNSDVDIEQIRLKAWPKKK